MRAPPSLPVSLNNIHLQEVSNIILSGLSLPTEEKNQAGILSRRGSCGHDGFLMKTDGTAGLGLVLPVPPGQTR